MNQCQIRVITNGYVVVYMDGAELIELCFDDRKELFEYLQENLDNSRWEIMANE